ncbi:MAG: 5'/3'-nucleotidase SurE [Bacteroidales bacterium]|nr:5'/3'-nucleotidase SurE [Bacteroidales bacterium]
MHGNQPLILVTNDDGYQAKGLRKLAGLMRPLGEVVVISTQEVMSAKGHSITTTPTLRAVLVNEEPGYREYVCNGTPVDCVKIGYQWLLDRLPDLVVSGINHGSNASTNVIYSGTMAAAIEACMDGIDAIGFSLDCYDLDADFDHLDGYITAITRDVLEQGLPSGVCLNVNFPKRGEEPIRGLRICRQAKAKWIEAYTQCVDERGGTCLKLGGQFVYEDSGEDTDYWALQNNYVSLVPTHFDLTATQHLETMHRFESILEKYENQG